MDILTLYRLDRWDGAERHTATPYHFRDRAVADEVAGDHDAISTVDIIICDSADEMHRAEDANKARQALGRLSAIDREALGLPRDLGEAFEVIQYRKQAEKDGRA
jgi:hypothetical protein